MAPDSRGSVIPREFYGHSQFGKERSGEFRHSIQGFPKQTAREAGVDAVSTSLNPCACRKTTQFVGCDKRMRRHTVCSLSTWLKTVCLRSHSRTCHTLQEKDSIRRQAMRRHTMDLRRVFRVQPNVFLRQVGCPESHGLFSRAWPTGNRELQMHVALAFQLL